MNIYQLSPEQKDTLCQGFQNTFGVQPDRFFSAPGRTELSGNHTDHQHGRVLAGAVNLDMLAAVRKNGTRTIQVLSQGYPMCRVELSRLEPVPSEINSTPALIRGVAARFAQLGCSVEGFDVYMTSTVLPGSGLSSSAAFEVLMGTIINHLFFDSKATQPEIAIIGQYAENVFFGKPSGLMDQMASAVGGMVTIDFADPQNPVIEPIRFDFATCGHALCIINTHAGHENLTDEYAAIPRELKKICAHFGKSVLREVDEDAFYAALPTLRQTCGDRAVMRALHFFRENARVPKQVAALKQGDFDTYLQLMKESGYSSWLYLQNVIVSGSTLEQPVAVALALCDRYLQGRGGFRVHGGGFAGTVQAFVPTDLLESFRTGIDGVLGEGSCHVLSIRDAGGVEIAL